jgi:glycosyltransferase involved in cell wall biosynthesis
MIKNLLSVIIPSRDPRYLQKTIDDLLVKAEGDIEIILVLDGLWHDPMPKEDPRVVIIHHGTPFSNKGMRESINKGMALARGEFVMKIDEHCMLDHGYDVKLKTDCEEDWVVIPRRKRLDPDKWENVNDGRCDIDHMFISYPYKTPNDKTDGLHGEIWTQKCLDNKDIPIEETPSLQGSCYFMRKSYWDSTIGPMDSENYGDFTGEAQEIGFKAFFSGGKLIRNKKTWYSHLHKGSKFGKGYGFNNEQYRKHGEMCERGRKFCRDYWLETQDYKYKWEDFINKFPDMPGWEGDWKQRLIDDKKLETI